MKKHTFKGGIYLSEENELTKNKEILKLLPGQELVYPIVGKLLVEEGEKVLKGQMITEADSIFDSVFSSVSGTVKTIESRADLYGENIECIVVENDEQYELTGVYNRKIAEDIEPSDTIEYVLANFVESEPCLNTCYRLMQERPEQLIQGMKELLSIYPNAKGIFGIEETNMDCVYKFQELLKDETRMQIKVLKTKYPQHLKQQLIYALTRRKMSCDMSPEDVGCVLYDTNDLLFIQKLYVEKSPVAEHVLTLSGAGVQVPGNYDIFDGMTFYDVVKQAGGAKEGSYKWICGGLMMGTSILWQEAPVVRKCKGILAIPYNQQETVDRSVCLKCGRCVEACPNKLIPSKLMMFSQKNSSDLFEKWGGMECASCGCCSYVCPSKIELKKHIYEMKELIRRTKDERTE